MSKFNLGAMHRSMSHFESCLSNMYRAINCYRKLRRHRDQDPLSLTLNIDKPSVVTDAIADRFRLMRHEIHHLEELVMDGRLQEGQPFALEPDGPETPHPTEANQVYSDMLPRGRWRLFLDVSGDGYWNTIDQATLFKRERVARAVARVYAEGRRRGLLVARITTKNGKRKVLEFERRDERTKRSTPCRDRRHPGSFLQQLP